MLIFICTVTHGAGWQSHRAPACYSEVVFFSLPTHRQLGTELNNLFLLSAWQRMFLVFMESAPWSEISLIPFKSWCFPMAAGLKWHSISVPCNFSSLLFPPFFATAKRKKWAHQYPHLEEKNPTISRLLATLVSFDLLQLPRVDLIPWMRLGVERLAGPSLQGHDTIITNSKVK